MGSVDLPYYVVKKGFGYFQPTKTMKRLGMEPKPLGPDGPAAWALATVEYRRWQRIRRGEKPEATNASPSDEAAELAIVYPRGSVGEGFQKFLRTPEWSKKALSTRGKVWWPAWKKRIRPAFADCNPNTLTLADLSEWQKQVTRTAGADPAHKAMKVFRTFWKALQGLHYTVLPDPSTGIRNNAPKPRQESWSEGEVVRLVKRALREKYFGLAALVAAIWDTSFQPGDVRTLKARHLGLTRDGRMLFDRRDVGRSKTGVPALGTVSARTAWLVADALDARGVTLREDDSLFVNRSGNAYRDDTLCDDFAVIRDLAFPGDKRQMRDMRRAGATEAVAGMVDPVALAAKLANSIHASDRLWRTYVKVEETAVRQADAARLRGRAKMRGEGKAEIVDLSQVRRRR